MKTYRVICGENWRSRNTSWYARITVDITNPIFQIGSDIMTVTINFDKHFKRGMSKE